MARLTRTGTTNLARAERQRQALELRQTGLSYEQIAQRLDCGKSTAHRDVIHALITAVPHTRRGGGDR